jgi:hypothetical protein
MTRTLVRNALAAMHLTKRSQMIGMGSAVSQALVGAWRLVSSEFRLSSGEVIHPYGTDAVGLLIYSVDGLMSAQIMRNGRLVSVAAAFSAAGPARVGGHSVATPSPPSFPGPVTQHQSATLSGSCRSSLTAQATSVLDLARHSVH